MDEGSTPSASTIFADVAQLVEHHVANVIVVGSSPITRSFAIVAQLVEHLICNQAAGGSSPLNGLLLTWRKYEI